MVVALLAIAGALGGLLIAPDVVGTLPDVFGSLCTAAENLPCRPLTLECLFAGAGILPAGYTATTDIPPWLGGGSTPNAPAAPQGNQPPQPRSPQDALNDPEFQRLKHDYAVEKDRAQRAAGVGLPTQAPSTGMGAADVLVQSIRNSNRR